MFPAALYTLDGVPWMVDLRAGRKDDLIPTVFALQALPMLLAVVELKHSDVAHFILSELLYPFVARLSRLWLCHNEARIAQIVYLIVTYDFSTAAMRASRA